MARLADRPEIAALLKVDAEDKKLRDFGRKLVDLVNPDTLRLHPSWMPCGCQDWPLCVQQSEYAATAEERAACHCRAT